MYTISGKIAVKETGAPVSDLIVRLIARPELSSKNVLTNAQGIQKLSEHSMASVLSDAGGNFKVELDVKATGQFSKDQNVSYFLVADAPDDVAEAKSKTPEKNREIYISKPLDPTSAKAESLIIRIPQSVLDTHQVGKDSLTSFDINSIAKINKEKFSQLKTITSNIEKKTEAGFKNFMLRVENKSSSNYFQSNNTEPLSKIQANVIDKSISNIPASRLSKSLNIRVNKDNIQRIGDFRENNGFVLSVNVEAVMNALIPNPSLEAAKKKCFRQITEEDIFPAVADTTTPSISLNGIPETNGHAGMTQEQLMQLASKMVSSATSPETALEYRKVVDPSYKGAKVCDTLNGLSICGGPADVTSYHDFQTIQIAFEHIWTEVFDEEIKHLGKQLYAEVVKLEEGYTATVQPTAQPVGSTGPAVVIPGTPIAGSGAAPAFAVGGGTVYVDAPTGGSTVFIQRSVPVVVPTRPEQLNTINDLEEFIRQFRVPGIELPQNILELVNQLDRKLSEAHRFEIFAPDSINYGLLYTFRQKWEPVNYQVGRLISSLPLAPKESRKYSMKTVKVLSRNQKMLDDQEYKSHSESSMTSRAEVEIINRAQNKTSFNLSASASYNAGAFGAQIQTQMGTEAENLSSETKKNFRESVVKAAQDFRKQNKTEIEISSKLEQEVTSSNEIVNPNDEIPVTFLFYELQRQYDISEELFKLQPVIFVANEVPMPNEIDFGWLVTYSWILQKVILDPMFLPALYYLAESGLSGTVSLQVLKDNLTKQLALVQTLTNEADFKTTQAQRAFDALMGIIRGVNTGRTFNGNELNNALHVLSSVTNPIGSIIGAIAENQAEEERFKRMKEAANMTLERQEKEKAEFAERLNNEVSVLERMATQYIDEMKKVMDREHAITQLRIHVKENILYYMQAIWDHEPPDQRFFRLYNLEIDWLEPAEEITEAHASREEDEGRDYYVQINLNYRCKRVKRKLIEVADLDNVLGYKGNYMIFSAKKRSHLHNYMMHDFIDEYSGGLKDPDGYAQYTTQELIDYLRCLKQNSSRQYESEKTKIIEILNEKLKLPRKEKERIVIPTNSVYIEALPGKHAILEDFKLVHRALDVKKVQAEVRRMELENLRYTSRLNKEQLGDPDFEKQVLISKANTDIDVSDT